MIHRKLQNVVYMKKKMLLKKRGGGAISYKKKREQHRVLSTSTCANYTKLCNMTEPKVSVNDFN